MKKRFMSYMYANELTYLNDNFMIYADYIEN